ncbi:MAG: 3-deoxy-D-manno-octulosonic acid transferase [Blastocatellia bacterium]|nr:MAG: 3-deoxy-D-manno-octulosonic acid transferase [Blastocatellia bacterium]
MYLAYSLLLTLGLIVLIPRFIYFGVAHGKYITGFRERLGLVTPLPNNQASTIWLHCVSVGETQAARPLVQRLRAEFPAHNLVVSTITRTGQQLARDVFKNDATSVVYFPFDWRFSVRRALRRIDPAVVVVMETELWPNFLRECRKRSIPVVLVNGRISGQSFRRYKLIKFFMKRVLSDITVALMQSNEDAKRINALGMNEENTYVTGNLKFDAPARPLTDSATEQLRQRFGFKSDTSVILAASTHSTEEQIVLESFRTLKYGKRHPVRLLLAPRHPERFREVAELLQKSGLNWARKTDPQQPSDALADVVLLDTIGELPATYSLATVVFVGGSLIDKGGHNVLEPAAAGRTVVTGAFTHNFNAIVTLLNEADAIVQLPRLDSDDAVEALRDTFDDLLTNTARREELATHGMELIINNQGASDRTLEILRRFVPSPTALP